MRFGSTCRDRAWWRIATVVAVVGLTPFVVKAPRVAAQSAETAARPSSATSVFRATSELVMLPVTVTDAAGNYVPHLTASDFAVFEDRVPQPVALFSTAGAPLDLLLLIDSSSSMLDRMAATQDAALTVIRSLRPEDRASIGVFNDRVQILQVLTSDKALLEQAVRQTTARGLTALYQALYVGFREMSRWRRDDRELRRQAAIVLSDGDDTSSTHVAFEDVLREARRSAVAVFTIFPGPTIPVPVVSAFTSVQHASFDLRVLAEESGGRCFRPSRLEELSTAYGQIAEELAQQYWLGYVPPPHASGGFKNISVRIVNHPELRIRTRRGYEVSDAHPQSPAAVTKGSAP